MKRLPSLLLVLAIVLPLFNWLHYQPLLDWWTDIGCMFLIALAWLAQLVLTRGKESSSAFPPAVLLAMGWLLLAVLLPVGGNQAGFQPVLKVSAFFVMAFSGGMLAYREVQTHGRESVVSMLAWGLLLAAFVQALFGLLQALGMASVGHDFIFFVSSKPGPSIPFGNIGQPNLFAHFLGWGALANCYLFASRRQYWMAWGVLAAFFALLMAWSGTRLVLAYAGGFILLAGLWWFRGSQDQIIRRFVIALITTTLLIMLAQLFTHELVATFTRWSGVQINVVSGADRLMDAGFGARRRIEWSKAWQVLLAHPLFGTGFGSYAWQSMWYEAYGGYSKVAENTLFTHSHNIIFQLMAETGLMGLIYALAALLYCLLPYLRRREATSENLMLIGLAMITLGHSMFEYPLWYMPFLCCFAIVLCLSPAKPMALVVRLGIRNALLVSICIGTITYAVSGVPIFARLVLWDRPPSAGVDTGYRIREMIALRQNPLWSSDVDLVLSNYLFPVRAQKSTQLALFYEIARFRPYFGILVKLAMLQALSQQAEQAQETLAMALVSFPHLAGQAEDMLNVVSEPEYGPLKELTAKVQIAYRQGGYQAAVKMVSAK
ncbi:Protein glycosylation ligase [Pseudogulbenkiania subflava DSM 22618]|uniref:Protein glycosylation ligase n=1 Tax=Pseudogulbenkiania subflava DSM 22618 TaxID=1123014 RepID=A0A1Y6C8W1_9NEIS|nr:Protein glycosylation ligase [Pseudogulbenkiania subflava DSM 22618]